MWYKENILYELHVRSFSDGDGDGIGDFKGLTDKLEYLERLGVGALWLLPFYPSPLRDDGYDIADYTTVHPDYGTLADFKRFLREAHARGLKVITELVLNHTSDQHPWFQRARRAKPGSRYRDFYVWSDSTDKYQDARIIFKDFEQSNWTWDPVAQAYYWHRFYSHQPDLNFDNPAVLKALFKVVDHWFDMGVDGLRLDAVPYLIERQGTNCENLPETHDVLKKLRAHVDAKYSGKMLLAEANQWPEDAVTYFGDGDECHMAFHFPVMPRIFMSLWTEDRYPVIDILEQTPDIPADCQWAIFLRNHDELTLEMVTDEERDYMYRAYASDTKARINLGIRRRLAPLMQNNRRRMEVINFLLFSFPGTPIIYYGDELGMGDNYHLGDRNGVRTPMQWSPDRNAGFSRANPHSLFLPVVIDPEYHYEVINVETQERNQTSLLWWMRRIIAMYKSLPALGKGRLEFVRGENTKILSFLRIHEDQRLLVLVNLSRYAQVAQLDLAELDGCTPVEVFGQSRFPPIGKTPYVVTLGPHGYLWLLLEESAASASTAKQQSLGRLGSAPEALTLETLREGIERILPSLIPGAVPDTPLARLRKDIRVTDMAPVNGLENSPVLTLAEGRLGQEHASIHLTMPLVLRAAPLEELQDKQPEAVLACWEHPKDPAGLTNGFESAQAVSSLARFLCATMPRHGQHGSFVPEAFVRKSRRAVLEVPADSCRMVRDSRHSICWSLGDRGFLKIFRLMEEGINPELEMLQALTKQGFPGVPRLLACLHYRKRRTQGMTLAVVQEYLQGAEDGRCFVEQSLRQMAERALASGLDAPDVSSLPIFTAPEITAVHREILGEYVLDFFRRLGERTAQLHATLARVPDQNFTPEPFSKLYLRASYQSMRNTAHRAQKALKERAQPGSSDMPLPMNAILRQLAKLPQLRPAGMRIRIHGDFQLDNILHKGRELFIVDFDGDVRLPLGERIIKRSPLRDVANLLISMTTLVTKSTQALPGLISADATRLSGWITLWRRSAGHSFLQAYLASEGHSHILPASREDAFTLLEIFLLEQILRHIIRDSEEQRQEKDILLNMLESYLKVFS